MHRQRLLCHVQREPVDCGVQGVVARVEQAKIKLRLARIVGLYDAKRGYSIDDLYPDSRLDALIRWLDSADARVRRLTARRAMKAPPIASKPRRRLAARR